MISSDQLSWEFERQPKELDNTSISGFLVWITVALKSQAKKETAS